MKLRNFFLMLAVVLAGGVMFTACSDDDDKDDNGGGGNGGTKGDKAVVGIWEDEDNPIDWWEDDEGEYAGDICAYMIYKADGKCGYMEVYFDKDEKYASSFISWGTWSTKDGKLSETYGEGTTVYEYTVKDDKLTEKEWDEEIEDYYVWTYKKTTEKDIQKWIDNAKEDSDEDGAKVRKAAKK